MLQDYKLRQREYLLEISRAITAQLDLDAVLRLIIQYAVEMLRGRAGLIALRQEDGTFHLRASYGLPAQLPHLFAPLFADIPYRLERTELASWTIPDLEVKLALVSAALRLPLRQVVALPLVIRNSLMGIIYVFRSEGSAFSTNDRQVLASFADQAAIAVQNARLYQEIINEKRRLDAIIANSGDGIMILDCERRVQVFNKALEAMTGVPVSRAMGQPCNEVLKLRDHQRGDSICEAECPLELKSPGEPLYVEGDVTRGDGSVITVGITYSPLFTGDDELVSVIANVRDITRFREAEEMKSTFISVISHELKTPVSLIKGYASTLRREDATWDEQTLRESLSVIEEESDRLTQLIDNLLDASRLQAGALKLEFGYVALNKLAAQTVENFRTQTQEHLLSLDFPPNFPPVLGDSERLRQVLDNLLSNAIKYSPQGGTIRVSGRADDDWVYVAVSDEGIGIPQDEQEHVFDRFYRVESSLSRRTQGAGLGLFLVKAVIEAHQGRVWVESVPAQGATFIFALPRT
ncbi:MAG: ATP-binding protein [Chloroflexota bacterium]|nr:ATP-binding protein [Chloroflexota bacterium]